MHKLQELIKTDQLRLNFTTRKEGAGVTASGVPVKLGPVSNDPEDSLKVMGAAVLPQDLPINGVIGQCTLECMCVEGTKVEINVWLSFREVSGNFPAWEISLTEDQFVNAVMEQYGKIWLEINKRNMLGIQ